MSKFRFHRLIMNQNDLLYENRTFAEQIEIPIEDVNIQQEKVKNGENKNIDIRHHAEEWIANHQELFDGWLEVAKSQILVLAF